MFDEDDSPYGMAKAAARCSDGMAEALKQIKPVLLSKKSKVKNF